MKFNQITLDRDRQLPPPASAFPLGGYTDLAEVRLARLALNPASEALAGQL